MYIQDWVCCELKNNECQLVFMLGLALVILETIRISGPKGHLDRYVDMIANT